jgi:hypothetical protein
MPDRRYVVVLALAALFVRTDAGAQTLKVTLLGTGSLFDAGRSASQRHALEFSSCICDLGEPLPPLRSAPPLSHLKDASPHNHQRCRHWMPGQVIP